MSRSTRTDIASIRLSITLPLSRSTSHNLADFSINTTALQIMSDECHDQASIQDVASAIIHRVLQKVEEARDVAAKLSLPSSAVSAHFPSLQDAKLDLATRQDSTSLESKSKPLSAETESTWNLYINAGDEPAQRYRVEMVVWWPMTTAAHSHQSQVHGQKHDVIRRNTSSVFSESGITETYPNLDPCRRAANFIESKPHTSFDVMAFEASQVVFQACERGEGTPNVTRFRIKVSDIGRSKSAQGRTYRIRKAWSFTTRWYNQIQNAQTAQNDRESSSGSHRALIALGSNVGNRTGMIEQTCTEMTRRGLKVLRTSSLYETEAMYKTDQPPFVNGVCEVCQI